MTKETNAGTTKPSKSKPMLTRESQLRKLLSRKSGATTFQIQKALGWQPHTARAAISRLRKTGAEIERYVSDKGSVYRVITADAKQ